ncbi:DUF2164 domain-containing protein [Anoxybacterium hadale]|uniref:DUF2164 domain-containing protein n=1 Tax=Anoxybacterium hadale TaxID=3408580 RepID=A0ACD1A7U6_9FIRM|nr:DUF2164 domain-containing protein [Clostridiales bacterium]
MKKNQQRIKLSKETKDHMITEIKRYYLNERDEELGDLAAALFLDFIIEELAPEFYNQGVYDSCNFMKDKSEDLLTIQI